jgi:hypothetical protein
MKWFRLGSFISICRFADHSLCPKLCLVHVKKADIGAKMSAFQAGVRMRTRACDGWGWRSTGL